MGNRRIFAVPRNSGPGGNRPLIFCYKTRIKSGFFLVVLHIFKVSVYYFYEFLILCTNGISINLFHDFVRFPSATLHDVLTGDSYSVHDRSRIGLGRDNP